MGSGSIAGFRTVRRVRNDQRLGPKVCMDSRPNLLLDLAVFFETPKPGWNHAGDPELLARNASGVAVVFADGRALLVPPDQTARLRWNP